jgi:hypothetical protein
MDKQTTPKAREGWDDPKQWVGASEDTPLEDFPANDFDKEEWNWARDGMLKCPPKWAERV